MRIFFFIFLTLTSLHAQTFLALDKTHPVHSVTLKQSEAIITMSDRQVTVPLTLMKGSETRRAHGLTPEGMAIGLKYNDVLLELYAVDKEKKNFMVAHFVDKDTDAPILPDSYKEAIAEDALYLSAEQFIQSYALWPVNSVARGYDLLGQKERDMVALFPTIRLEIADKLCRASLTSAGLFEILSDETGVSCDDLSLFNKKTPRETLHNQANHKRKLLMSVMACAQGAYHPDKCEKISQLLATHILQAPSLQQLMAQF